MSGAGIPPGWYPDPSNASQQRYWDGSAWTDATAPGAPGYGYGAPGYSTPGYGHTAPGYGGQGYGAPTYGTPGYGTTQVGYGYAQAVGAPLVGFWIRLGASIIDSILLSVPSNVLYGLADVGRGGFTVSSDLSVLGATSGAFWLIWFLNIAIGFAYYGYLEGTSGQTLGKRICGITVVDGDSLQPGIGVLRGMGRHLASFLSQLICLLGYLWMLWDPQKQTWHDKMARTKVVKNLK